MHNYPSSQKEASTLAVRSSQIGTRYAWNLSKPDMHSRLAGGVCTAHHARHKGYSDFVQHTGPVMSGQLRVSLSYVQTLRVTFGYSQTAHNSYRVEQSLCRRNSRVQIGRNSLMGLNSGESLKSNNPLMGLDYRGSREMAKHGGSPSSEVPTKFVGSWWDGADLLHEKGNAANVALGMNSFLNHEENQHSSVLSDDCFFSHQENQHLAEPQGNRKPNLAYEQNQHLAEPQDNSPPLRGDVACLQPSFSQSQNHTRISGDYYETFVGHRVTRSKPVQPSGVSLAFLRCLRLISPCKAVTTNCPVVSPSSFNSSIALATSCGTRAAIVCDFALTDFVAISELLRVRCSTVWQKESECKRLTCSTPYPTLVLNTLSTSKAQEAHKITKPAGATNTNGPLTTNDRISIEAAMSDHITPLTGRNSLTLNKFTWRFLAVSRSDRNAKPCRMSVEAPTEREARQVLAPHFILSLAARLPVQEVNHV